MEDIIIICILHHIFKWLNTVEVDQRDVARAADGAVHALGVDDYVLLALGGVLADGHA